MKYRRFRDIPKFTRSANYQVNISWHTLDESIKRYVDQHGAILDPEFQRAHVWNEAQQKAYVEFILRGGKSSKAIYWNCKGWMNSFSGPFVLVDGKQRLEAALKFVTGKLKAFGGYIHEFEDQLGIMEADFIFHVNDLETHKEVLQWYLGLNAGGTPHTDQELEKVRKMLKKA